MSISARKSSIRFVCKVCRSKRWLLLQLSMHQLVSMVWYRNFGVRKGPGKLSQCSTKLSLSGSICVNPKNWNNELYICSRICCEVTPRLNRDGNHVIPKNTCSFNDVSQNSKTFCMKKVQRFGVPWSKIV